MFELFTWSHFSPQHLSLSPSLPSPWFNLDGYTYYWFSYAYCLNKPKHILMTWRFGTTIIGMFWSQCSEDIQRFLHFYQFDNDFLINLFTKDGCFSGMALWRRWAEILWELHWLPLVGGHGIPKVGPKTISSSWWCSYQNVTMKKWINKDINKFLETSQFKEMVFSLSLCSPDCVCMCIRNVFSMNWYELQMVDAYFQWPNLPFPVSNWLIPYGFLNSQPPKLTIPWSPKSEDQ